MTNQSLKHRANKLKQMVSLLADVRNMCAHDDMLVGFVHKRVDIGSFPEHALLDLRKTSNGSLIQGRKDFTAVLISIRNLVDKQHFDIFMGKLMQLIGELQKFIPGKSDQELLDYIGLPKNYALLQSF